MDFTKIFKEISDNSGSGLGNKIGNPPKMKTSNYLCMWSDLLGFGDMFFKNDWQLNETQKKEIYSRLQQAHNTVLYYSSPFNERNLILNDGIAKVFKVKKDFFAKTKLNEIGFFLRTAIQVHVNINHTEISNNLPGCRTVIAFGEGVQYLTEEVRFDDYVLNYTKPKGKKISDIAKENGNPIIIYNPIELQMNTAFSKAYLLENCGSKRGLDGNNLYIDESVINAICNMCIDEKIKWIYKEENDNIMFLVPYKHKNSDNVILGFKFHKHVLEIELKGWKTKVYKVLNFYPYDEEMSKFSFNLEDINDNFQ